MVLKDRETRRCYCEIDRIVFLAKEGGWVEEEGSRKSTGSSKQLSEPLSKSYGTCLLINVLLPGASVMYAGKRVGVIYPVLTLIFITVYWPPSPIVIAVSYFHTAIAVGDSRKMVSRPPSVGLPGAKCAFIVTMP